MQVLLEYVNVESAYIRIKEAGQNAITAPTLRKSSKP
jgi:hypothetical protein